MRYLRLGFQSTKFILTIHDVMKLVLDQLVEPFLVVYRCCNPKAFAQWLIELRWSGLRSGSISSVSGILYLLR